MKRLILGIALMLCTLTTFSQIVGPKYRIAGREIDARLFKKNLEDNVNSYMDYQGWSLQERRAFLEMYSLYVDNLTTGRFSTDAFWTITDHKGELDDKKILYYDRYGNLRKEKPRKPWYETKSHYERTLRTFIPAKKVASYAKYVGQALIEELDRAAASTNAQAAQQETESKHQEWTGTGFALNYHYVATNYHVVKDAKTIKVAGINGNLNIYYSASVVATDKANDLAIIRINDSRFNGFNSIPYSVTTRLADVGEDVFVLGYPLTQALGNEIKLTNGIVSSRTGYLGDVSTYQMSAPVQPGNSGGPMFDSKGNVIGIVVSGVPGAENVGYAIKTSYLKTLIESAGLNVGLPTNNTVSSLSLAEKVKRVKNFVLYIECSK